MIGAISQPRLRLVGNGDLPGADATLARRTARCVLKIIISVMGRFKAHSPLHGRRPDLGKLAQGYLACRNDEQLKRRYFAKNAIILQEDEISRLFRLHMAEAARRQGDARDSRMARCTTVRPHHI
jgi:hypothetical protein